MANAIDLLGKKINRLIVLERVESDKTRRAMWRCICDCGNECIVAGSSIYNNLTKSCGCLSKETQKRNLEIGRRKKYKHGMSQKRIYKEFILMKSRCTCKKSPKYKDYGGRGIAVCKEWSEDFNKFYEWAIKNGYKEDLTLDRINVNGNYEPSNCRWVTNKFQQNNKRNNHYLTFNGKTQSISNWAEELGINKKTLYARICDRKWSVERALTTK